MAGAIVGGAIQTTFATISFAGAGYLFKFLDSKGYQEETKRHNKATEDLAKAKEIFYENEVKQRDRIPKLRQELADANEDLGAPNRTLDNLRKVQTVQYNGMNFNREPKLGDFYQPSKEMKDYQMLAIGVIGGGVGNLIHKLV